MTATPDTPAPDTTIRWSRCQGLAGVLEAAPERVRMLVPDAFELSDAGLPTTRLVFEGVRCERVDAASLRPQEGSYFQAYVPVAPRNASWGEGLPSWFVLDPLIHPVDAAAAARRLGVPATASQESWSRVPAGPVEMRSHRFEAATAAVEFTYQSLAASDQADLARTHHWYAQPTAFVRVDAERALRWSEPMSQMGVLRVEGTAQLSTVLAGVCCATWTGQAYANLDAMWEGSTRVFARDPSSA